jgi:hypothetical protein
MRSQKAEAKSMFVLSAKTIEGLETVGQWDLPTLAADMSAWAEQVCETASSDAEGRGSTTSYALRHMRDDKCWGSTNLKRVVVEDDKKDSAFDGTANGLATKFLASLERAHSQVIESQKASLDALRASQGLLAQSFVMIGQLQVTNVQLHNKTLELGEVNASQASANGKPDVFRVMLETMGPTVAEKAMEKLLPTLLKLAADASDDEPSGTEQREPS